MSNVIPFPKIKKRNRRSVIEAPCDIEEFENALYIFLKRINLVEDEDSFYAFVRTHRDIIRYFSALIGLR